MEREVWGAPFIDCGVLHLFQPKRPPYFHLKSPSLTHPLSLSRSSRLQMCRGSSVADIYSKSASEGSSIRGALIERAPPPPHRRCGNLGRWRSREGLWTALKRRRNKKPEAKEHFQKESEGKLCTTKQQKSLAKLPWFSVVFAHVIVVFVLVQKLIKCADCRSFFGTHTSKYVLKHSNTMFFKQVPQ